MSVSLQDFLINLRRCLVLYSEQFDAVQQSILSETPLPTASEVADRMVQEKVLTPLQSRRLQGRSPDLNYGEFIIEELIGTGGQGNVYRARQPKVGNRVVALKTLTTVSPTTSERFAREIKAAASLDHPNIVVIYGAGEEGDTPFYAMKYVEGRDLQTVINQDGPLDLSLAIQYTVECAEGLEHAHNRGVIHRDFKPLNVLISDEGRVQILDLGIAKLSQDHHSLATFTHTGARFGTPVYMAPEQWNNTPGVSDRH